MKPRQDNRAAFDRVLRAFGDAARQEYQNHAFEAGYLQSLCLQMLGYMPKRHQQMFIDDMTRAAQKMSERAGAARQPQA